MESDFSVIYSQVLILQKNLTFKTVGRVSAMCERKTCLGDVIPGCFKLSRSDKERTGPLGRSERWPSWNFTCTWKTSKVKLDTKI